MRLLMLLRLLVVIALTTTVRGLMLPNFTDHLNETRNLGLYEVSRKKKNKNNYFMGLILGAILIKMILFPLAVKAMAVMSSVSVLLSTMSLIISSIVGYAKLVVHHKAATEPVVKLVHVNDVWAKGDAMSKDHMIPDDSLEYAPNVALDQQMYYNIK